MRHLALVSIIVLGLSACGGDNKSPTSPTPIPPPPPPPPFSFTGTWTGPITIAGAELPPGTATVTITQTGSSLSGTWSTVYPTEPPLTTSGAFSGTANGMALQGTLSPSDPDLCSYTINATVSGTVMTGTFATVNCTGSESGTVMLTRQ